MKHHYNRQLKRYVLAIILLVAAGYITMFVKDTIDAQNPEKSLPIISITTGYTVVAEPTRAGYEWKFGYRAVMSPFLEPPDVPITTTYEAMPGMPILINFSSPAEQISVYEAEGISATEFYEKRLSIQTPEEEGVYVYKVVAQFERGTIVHYFALDVKRPHLIS